MGLLEKIIGKETMEELKKTSERQKGERKEVGEVKLAGLRERISAYIADTLIVSLFGFVILFIPLLLLYSRLGGGSVGEVLKTMNPFYFIAVLSFFYGGLLIGEHGWTLGKRSAKLKVVTEGDFKAVGFLRAFLREGIKIGLMYIPLYVPYISIVILLLNIYLIKSTPKRQAIHDKIMGTQVIVTAEIEKFRIY